MILVTGEHHKVFAPSQPSSFFPMFTTLDHSIWFYNNDLPEQPSDWILWDVLNHFILHFRIKIIHLISNYLKFIYFISICQVRLKASWGGRGFIEGTFWDHKSGKIIGIFTQEAFIKIVENNREESSAKYIQTHVAPPASKM